jgi:hypothetical protein
LVGDFRTSAALFKRWTIEDKAPRDTEHQPPSVLLFVSYLKQLNICPTAPEDARLVPTAALQLV